MGVTTTQTNKPFNPRGNDQSPKGYNRAKLYSGKALDFDGVNDSVDLNSSIDFTGDFSFCFYFSNTLTITRGIISNGTNVDSIGTNATSNKSFRFRLNSVNVDFDINSVYDDGLNFWSFVRSDSTLYVYKNGLQVGSQTVATNTFTLGMVGAQGVGVNYFNGQLTNLKAFNTALTAAQVADLYNNPEKVVPTGVDNTALKLWLPMMEGAGTTAYDGSGNGNHGTISGGTYVNGIGAPVAQSAVIDWNKGTNRMIYSEQFDNAAWLKAATILTANDTTAPDGSQTADKIEFTAAGAEIYDQFINVANSLHIGSVFLKNENINSVQLEIIGGGPVILGQTTIDLTDGSLSASVGDYTPVATDEGNGWYRVSVGDTGETTIATPALKIKRVGSNGSFYAWGAQVEAADSLGAYIPNHTGTPITSEVLLPQGLTTGRDITGVNLFENVRKQGALNLDGNSGAEVHDNASLDFGTGGFTLEVWAKLAYENTGSSYNGVLGLGNSLSQGATAYIYTRSAGPRFFINGTSLTIATTLDEGNWHHLVVTRTDAGAIQTYYDGAEGAESGTEASTMTNALTKFIGRDASTTRYYQDQIAQPRIYNRALTAEEVQRSYDSNKNIYTNS